MDFADHFSGHAQSYAESRPTYPAQLFEELAARCPGRALAWDAGCGNGQATIALAAHFDAVVGSDPSAAQIAQAPAHPRVSYRVEPAESPSLAPGSVDLVIAAQALHWFDQGAFHPAVHRVLRPGGVFAAITYAHVEVDAGIDVWLAELRRLVAPYWPPERVHVDRRYVDLPFPYTPLEEPLPPMMLRSRWNRPALRGYLRSWSAVRRYMAARGADPLDAIEAGLCAVWPDASATRELRWPLTVRAGRPLRARSRPVSV